MLVNQYNYIKFKCTREGLVWSEGLFPDFAWKSGCIMILLFDRRLSLPRTIYPQTISVGNDSYAKKLSLCVCLVERKRTAGVRWVFGSVKDLVNKFANFWFNKNKLGGEDEEVQFGCK